MSGNKIARNNVAIWIVYPQNEMIIAVLNPNCFTAGVATKRPEITLIDQFKPNHRSRKTYVMKHI